MAKAKQEKIFTLEGQQLLYVRNSFGKESAIFTGTKGKVVTLLGWRAEAISAFLAESPMPENYGIIPNATNFTHEIRTKKGAVAGTGWTWLKFNGRVQESDFRKLLDLGFKLSKKNSDEIAGVYAYYAQVEIADVKVRKAIKL